MSDQRQGARRKDAPSFGAVVTAAELKAAAAAHREEEAAAKAIHTCQNASLLVFLEGIGTDAVAYALDVSHLSLPLLSMHWYSSARSRRPHRPHQRVQDSIAEEELRSF